jgi:uncharacterized membrane protein YecN with MAPEG domain
MKRLGRIVGICVSLILFISFIYLVASSDPSGAFVSQWRFTSLATLGAMIVYQYVSLQVNKTRGLYKIPLPEMTGPDHFNRVFRVHMNTLENMPLFLPLLWLFALIWGDLWAGIFGAVWVAARFLYAWGYYREVALRVCGFGISSTVNLLMLLGCIYGAVAAN